MVYTANEKKKLNYEEMSPMSLTKFNGHDWKQRCWIATMHSSHPLRQYFFLLFFFRFSLLNIWSSIFKFHTISERESVLHTHTYHEYNTHIYIYILTDNHPLNPTNRCVTLATMRWYRFVHCLNRYPMKVHSSKRSSDDNNNPKMLSKYNFNIIIILRIIKIKIITKSIINKIIMVVRIIFIFIIIIRIINI